MRSKPSYKCALITGGKSGLGKAIAELLQEKQIETIVTSSDEIDLSHPSQREKLLQKIALKKPNLIINNAGFGLYGETVKLSIEEQKKMIEINITATFEISIFSAKQLLKNGQKGTILNISSAAAFFPFPLFNIYASSKAFVRHFSEALDAELKEQGIRVLCACPGQIATNFRTRAAQGAPQKKDRRTMSAKQAAQHLWWQIERQKPVYIFDGKTRLMVQIGRLLPKCILRRILKKEIKSRIPFSSSPGI